MSRWERLGVTLSITWVIVLLVVCAVWYPELLTP